MASVTTYLQATNAVLRATSSPYTSAAAFASPAGQPNAREVQQAKEIVSEVYKELQNDRPDSYWNRTAEIKIFKPFTEGGVVKVWGGLTNNIDFAFDGSLDLNSIPWLLPFVSNPTPLAGMMLHIQGERQYYRPDIRQSATRLHTKTENIENVGYDDVAHPLAYSIFKYAYALPDDFRDVLNVYNPYVGTDVRPMGFERLVEGMIGNGLLETTAGAGGFGADPDFYAIDRPDGGGAPVLAIHPIPAEDRVLTLRYQAQATSVVNATDTFDIDEDAIPWFLNLCKARASLEIAGNPAAAGMYEQWAERGKRNAEQKSMETGGEFQRVRPSVGEDYRAHYSSRNLRSGDRGIYLRR